MEIPFLYNNTEEKQNRKEKTDETFAFSENRSERSEVKRNNSQK